jgi:hypothetical protein
MLLPLASCFKCQELQLYANDTCHYYAPVKIGVFKPVNPGGATQGNAALCLFYVFELIKTLKQMAWKWRGMCLSRVKYLMRCLKISL